MLNNNDRDCLDTVVAYVRTASSNNNVNRGIKLFFVTVILGAMISALIEDNDLEKLAGIITGSGCLLIIFSGFLRSIGDCCEPNIPNDSNRCRQNFSKGINRLSYNLTYTAISTIGLGVGLFSNINIRTINESHINQLKDDVVNRIDDIMPKF